MRLGMMMGLMMMVAATPVLAAEPTCPSVPVPPPAGMAGWSKPGRLAAGPAATSAPAIGIGSAADVALVESSRLRFAAPPGKAIAPGSHGGLLALTVAEAGTYRVALGGPAWVDLVQGARALPSTAHGHGPACTGIRKIVDFALTPGRYTLQLASSAAPSQRVMVLRLP